MQRHGGKRIRIDEPPPEVAAYQQQQSFNSNYGYMNYGQTDQVDYDHHQQLQMHMQMQQQLQMPMQIQQPTYEPADGVRMTRSRTRGGAGSATTAPLPAANMMEVSSYSSSSVNVNSPQPVTPMQTSPRSVNSNTNTADLFVQPAPVTEHRGRGRKPTRNRVPDNTQEDEHSLYYMVKNNKYTLSKIVDDWTDFYKNSRKDALLSLMNFFINSSGCKGKITKEMQSMEHKDIIRIMTEEFDEDSGEYPVMMTAQIWKKFKSNFCDFIQLLIKRCQYSIIYDQYLMDNIISLLTGLSDSQVRAFRHTSTLAAMKMMTALVDVALAVSLNLETNQRQYQTEYQKSKDKRGSGPLESILAKRQELEENIDEIKNMLTYMFKSVFVHRYRDTVPDIRAIAMTEIGIWMYKFHSNFLDDSYLKYIGWTLYDKVGDVRLRCLQSLQPLYASEELKGKLELFTNKFKDRIIAMALDKEYEVSVNAVKLVTSILKFNPEILSDKDCEHIYELVYSTHRGLAQAAGEFLNERLFQPTDIDPGTTLRGKPRSATTPLVRDLVQFFIESDFYEHGTYLVDSLIDSNPIVRDWECMTDLLLEDAGPNEEPLDNQQETALIEIMTCSIRQTATGEPPVCRGPNRKTSHKEAKIVADDKKKLTEHFIKALPLLLDKYLSDSEKICNLVQIPQFFDLDLYTTNRQETSLLALLEKLKAIVKTQHDTEVLEQCAKTLEYLCGESHAVASRCEISRSTIIDLIVSNYKENYDEWKSVVLSNLKPNEDEKFNLVDSLKKVSIFFSLFNLNKSIGWTLLYQELNALTNYVDPDHILPIEGLIFLIKNCLLSILWYFSDIEEKGESDDLQDSEDLRQMMNQFVNILTFILNNNFTDNLKEAAFSTLSDFFIFFNYNLLSEKGPELAILAYKPDDNIANILNYFIQKFVFVSDEDGANKENKIEELHNRRRYLAGYSKLISCNILPIHYAADVFRNYVKFYNEFGDIIKHLLAKAREICKVQCTATMCLSLQKTFLSIKELYGPGFVIKNTEEFVALKELTKRFALSLGLDAMKNKHAVLRLHRDGIIFAVKSDDTNDPLKPPPNIVFFDILAEFTNKLLKQDKKIMLNFLDSQVTHGMPSNRPEEWQSLSAYRNSLIHGDSDLSQSVSKRTYIRKRKDNGDDEDQAEDNYTEETM